jgi:hypothetical protein
MNLAAVALWCVLSAVLATGCAARPPAHTFADLQHRLRPGATVYVIDDTGVETKGRVLEVAPSTLSLSVDGGRREMGEATVRQVQRYGDPLWNGLAIGAAVAVPGALIADPTYDPCSNMPQQRCANSQAGQRVLMIGVTAAIGAGIDALIRGRHQVYLSPAGASEPPRRVAFGAHVRIAPSEAALIFNVRR